MEVVMLGWLLSSLVMAIIAGFLGFSSVAIHAAAVAQVICPVFLLLSLVPLVTILMRRQATNGRKNKVRHLKLVPRPVDNIYVADKKDFISQEEKRL
jgi:uncharacterized membrane protein YtjA (UPF0391 family)